MIFVLKQKDELFYGFEYLEKTFILNKESLSVVEELDSEFYPSSYEIIDYMDSDYNLEYKIKDNIYKKLLKEK